MEISESVHSTLSYIDKPDKEKIQAQVADLLSANGFNEMMANSLTKSAYYENSDNEDPTLVRIMNPLSSDLNTMRKTLLYGGLEAINYNTNRRNPDLKLFEFGNVYCTAPDKKAEKSLDKYFEEEHRAIRYT